jgi:hypothetical protein
MLNLHGESNMSDTNEELWRALDTIREESARLREVSETLRREVAELRALILQDREDREHGRAMQGEEDVQRQLEQRREESRQNVREMDEEVKRAQNRADQRRG